jgi:Phosphodiester glycosidase
VLWCLGVLVFGLFVWLASSFAVFTLRPSSMNFSEKSAEWVRTLPFGNWAVDEAEHIYYSDHAPKKGGPQLTRLPSVGLGTTASDGSPSAPGHHVQNGWPSPITPVFATPLPDEGVWERTGPDVDGKPPVLVTTYRPDPTYPQMVAYVAWFNHSLVDLAYYPGRYEPPKASDRGPSMVPDDQRYRLLATFNAGFIYSDGDNGSSVNGHTNEPMTDGNATLVGFKNGQIAIIKWSGGPNPGTNVAWARQSLAPIVWHGVLNPELNTNPDSPQWGFTVGNAVRVWRTGVGIDKEGNLIFVVANDQTVVSLAQILQHAGAVDAMEFDINADWHTLITYSHLQGLDPTMVEPQPEESVDRYLYPDDRDFFAVYRRVPGPVAVPFS